MPSVRVLVVAVCVLSSMLALVVDQSSARAVGFGPAMRLGDRSDRAGTQIQGVAINARGEAVAVWTRNRAVRVASRSAAGRWGRPVTVSRNRCLAGKSFQVAMNERGDAVVVWMLGCDEGPPTTTAVVTRAGHHRWSAPRTLRNTGGSAVGMTARGVAVLGWVEGPWQDGGKNAVQVATGRGGRWSGAKTLGETTGSFALDVHANGRAAAMWSTPSGLTVSRRAPSGAWMPAEVVWTLAEPLPGVPPMSSSRPLEVAIAGDGQVIGAWSTGDSSITGVIEVVEYRLSEGWSAPRTLITYYELWPWISLDLNDRGEAIIGWKQWRKTPKTRCPAGGNRYSHHEVFAATRAASARWSSPRRLSPRNPRVFAGEPLVAITGRGQMFATWPVSDPCAVSQRPGEFGRDLGIESATGSVSSGWRERVAISRRGNGGIGFALQLAVADGPRAIIGWDQRATPHGRRNPTSWISVTR